MRVAVAGQLGDGQEENPLLFQHLEHCLGLCPRHFLQGDPVLSDAAKIQGTRIGDNKFCSPWLSKSPQVAVIATGSLMCWRREDEDGGIPMVRAKTKAAAVTEIGNNRNQ